MGKVLLLSLIDLELLYVLNGVGSVGFGINRLDFSFGGLCSGTKLDEHLDYVKYSRTHALL